MFARLLLPLGLVAAAPAAAESVSVQVRGQNGQPVAGAVVSVSLVGRATPAPRPMPVRQVTQQNIQFHPFVLVVPVGTPVTFPNLDAVRHHVYSFSPAKKFELKLYAREQNRTIVFDKAGVVPLGCNIHDQMSAYIDVVDTPWFATTDAHGNAVIDGLPAGAVTVKLWHPYLRAPGNQLIQSAHADAKLAFTANLRSPPRAVGASPY